MNAFGGITKAGVLFICLSCLPLNGFAFEHTKVLPKGVRNLNIRYADTAIGQKTNQSGALEPLSRPLAQDLTFKKIINDRKNMEQIKLKGFLSAHGFQEDHALGRYAADLKAQVNVAAPILAYGLTERLTVAVAVPFYRATTAVELGFHANETGEKFVNALSNPANNLTSFSIEASEKLNGAVYELQSKLAMNDYRPIDKWQGSGLGDVTVAAKYRTFESRSISSAMTAGLVAPTGRTDHPDIVTDLPFGDGQWDLFGGLIADQPIWGDFFANQYATYTFQLPGRKNMRLITEDELIEVPKRDLNCDLGDRFDGGLSLQYEKLTGLMAGLGYVYLKKFNDKYDVARETKTKLEKETDQSAHFGEALLGYSTVQAFQKGLFPVPVMVTLAYKKHISSRNLPVSDLAQVDVSMFF